MPGPTAIVYIDGFNLYYGALKGTQYKWLNLEAFADALLPANDVLKVRYFTARISGRDEDPTAPNRQAAYMRALTTLPRVEVTEGQFLVSTTRMRKADPNALPRTVEVIKTEEKGSDVNLATYLMRDAYRDEAEVFVVVSNDSDLLEPMRLVKSDAQKVVGLVSPYPRQSRRLLRCSPDFSKLVRTHLLAGAQFPDAVMLSDGSEITKPTVW